MTFLESNETASEFFFKEDKSLEEDIKILKERGLPLLNDFNPILNKIMDLNRQDYNFSGLMMNILMKEGLKNKGATQVQTQSFLKLAGKI